MTTASERKILTREEILGVADVQIEPVEVPEWGGIVFVQGLTGKQRDEFEIALLQGKGRNRQVNLHNLRSKLIARSVVDSDGKNGSKPKRVFTDSDAEKLGEKSAQALQRVFAVAQRLSGLSDEDVEELTDDLGEDPSVDSGSG